MRAVIVAVAVLALSRSATAQSPIVGTWEEINRNAVDGKPQDIPCYVIYTADGHFSRLCVTANRPKLKDDKGLLFDDLTAQFGTYTIAGDRMTRRVVAAKVPTAEGQDVTVTWRLDNGVLVIRGLPNGPEARYHRAK